MKFIIKLCFLTTIFAFVSNGYAQNCIGMQGGYSVVKFSQNEELQKEVAFGLFQNKNDIPLKITLDGTQYKTVMYDEKVDVNPMTGASFVDKILDRKVTECALKFEDIEILKVNLNKLNQEELTRLYEISSMIWGEESEKMSLKDFRKVQYLAVQINELVGVTTIIITIPLNKK